MTVVVMGGGGLHGFQYLSDKQSWVGSCVVVGGGSGVCVCVCVWGGGVEGFSDMQYLSSEQSQVVHVIVAVWW